MLGLFRRKRHERAGFALYTEAVQAARDAWFYTDLGVPDTLDGRFDLVGLHVSLLIERLRREAGPGPGVAQAVFDAMFADMDFNLREMGAGDMSVGKRMKEMWEAFHGRARAYEAALQADQAGMQTGMQAGVQPGAQPGDGAGLEEALVRNVWRGEAPAGAGAALARYVRETYAALAAAPLERFLQGTAPFPAARAEVA